jgi:hypothetical protein
MGCAARQGVGLRSSDLALAQWARSKRHRNPFEAQKRNARAGRVSNSAAQERLILGKLEMRLLIESQGRIESPEHISTPGNGPESGCTTKSQTGSIVNFMWLGIPPQVLINLRGRVPRLVAGGSRQ